MTNNPRKHHFIPQCYLTPFTDSKRKFWKKDKEGSKIYNVTPAQVCYEIDSNKIRTKNPILFDCNNDDYFIEKEAFKDQENNYGKTVQQVIRYSSNPILIEKTKYILFLETLITIKRRNPVSRTAIIDAFAESVMDPNYVFHFKKFLAEETGVKNLPDEVDDYIKSYLETEAKNPDRHYDMYLSAYTNRKEYTTITNLKNELYSLKQFILHAPIGSEFITSDNPGFTIVNNNAINLGGFGDNFSFCFPISPRTCLFVKSNKIEQKDNLEKLIHPRLVGKNEVHHINEVTRKISNEHIFSLNKEILEKI